MMKVKDVAMAMAMVLPGLLTALPAPAQGWPEIFDPFTVHDVHLELSPADWDTIRFDLTNEIEVPAQLWLDGESSILVSVRRKSSRALPSEADPRKIGLKVDINEYVDGQLWHGVNKVSLENGADAGPVKEGFAWALHELASPPGYHAALASWVNVHVNGEYLGVYVNAEQRDKRFLQNRGLFVKNQTWLYEIDDINGYELEEGDPHSPAYNALCYSPFQAAPGRKKPSTSCATPSDATLATQLPALIDMASMLRQGAVDAFTDNPDALFTHGKNYFFADFSSGLRRYYPWDLDAVFRSTSAGIYGKPGRRGKVEQTVFQSVILNHAAFRAQYNQILTDLLNGPLSASSLHTFLDAAEAAVAPHLAGDPYQSGSAGDFDALKSWVSDRIASVLAQVAASDNPPPRP